MRAVILSRPTTFDRVDRVKVAVGDTPLPGDAEVWILGQPLVVDVDGERHEVARGFTTDGASIPVWGRWLTGWQPWDPPQRWAAIVHDWLYCLSGVPRSYADYAFHGVLRSEGANCYQCAVMFWAVRMGASNAYHMDQFAGPIIYP